MAIGLIIAFCVIGVGMAVGGKAVVHYRRADLDYNNTIIKELSQNGVYPLEMWETYQLDIDSDGQEETLQVFHDFIQAFGNRVFVRIDNKEFELESLGEEDVKGAYETKATYAQAELVLDAENRIYIRVYVPYSYGYEECMVEFKGKHLYAINESVEIVDVVEDLD